jgi:hypothetical protein
MSDLGRSHSSDRPAHPASRVAAECFMYACHLRLVNGYPLILTVPVSDPSDPVRSIARPAVVRTERSEWPLVSPLDRPANGVAVSPGLGQSGRRAETDGLAEVDRILQPDSARSVRPDRTSGRKA